VSVWPLLAVLVAEGAIVLVLYLLVASYLPPATLVAYDAVSLPGEEVSLNLRLVQDLPPLLKGRVADVEILVTPAPHTALGETRGVTQSSGSASVSLTAPTVARNYPFHAQARSPGGDEIAAADFELHVIPAQAKLLITTLSDTLWSSLLEKINRQPTPHAQASEVLGELATSHAILYLDSRSGNDPERIRSWLHRHGFPRGPLLVPDLMASGTSDEPYGKRIEEYLEDEVRSRWKNVAWGIGSSSEEMRAFRESNIRALHVGVRSPPLSDGPGVEAALDWSAVRDRLSDG
jgi:hypothetical protein